MVLAGRSADVASVRIWLLSVTGDNVTAYNVSFAWTCGASSGFCPGPDACPLSAGNGTLEYRGLNLPALSTVDWTLPPLSNSTAGVLVRFDYADLTFADSLVVAFDGADAGGTPLAPRYIRGPLSGEALTPCVLNEPRATGLTLTLTTLHFRTGGFSLSYYGGTHAAAQRAVEASAGTRACPDTPPVGSAALPPRLPGYAPPDPSCQNMWNNFAEYFNPAAQPFAFKDIRAIHNCSGAFGDRMGYCMYTSADFNQSEAALIAIAAPAGPLEITISALNYNTALDIYPELHIHSGCTPADVFYSDGGWVRAGRAWHSTTTTPTIASNGNIAVIYLRALHSLIRPHRKDRYRVAWRVLEDASEGEGSGFGQTVIMEEPSGEFGTCTYDNVTGDCSGLYDYLQSYLWTVSAPEGYIVNLGALP
eukprot:tig00000133_g7671.t1